MRDVLAAQDGEPVQESQILTKVNYLVGGGVGLSQLREEMEWNLSEGFIRSEWMDELEIKAWFITKAGINHDRIK